jgi:hypothetical protein
MSTHSNIRTPLEILTDILNKYNEYIQSFPADMNDRARQAYNEAISERDKTRELIISLEKQNDDQNKGGRRQRRKSLRSKKATRSRKSLRRKSLRSRKSLRRK